MIQGLFGLLDDQKVLAMGGQPLLVDISGWAWMHIIIGLLVLLTGIGILSGSRVAQPIAFVVVALNAISQVFTVSVYPWWGVTMLILDICILWALCVYRPARIE